MKVLVTGCLTILKDIYRPLKPLLRHLATHMPNVLASKDLLLGTCRNPKKEYLSISKVSTGNSNNSNNNNNLFSNLGNLCL